MTTAPTHPSLDDDAYALAYPELRAFWEAARDARLLLRHCRGCDRSHWYPRLLCPLCGSDATDWRDASGQGALYAFSEVLRTDVPYVLAYVRLDEGPVLMTNLVDCDAAALRIGQRVRALWRQLPSGRHAPFFTPADTPQPPPGDSP